MGLLSEPRQGAYSAPQNLYLILKEEKECGKAGGRKKEGRGKDESLVSLGEGYLLGLRGDGRSQCYVLNLIYTTKTARRVCFIV